MSDLTCGPSSNAYFTPAEPLTCEAPPEPLVCQAPPPPPPKPPAPPKDHVSVAPKAKVSTGGSSNASFGFLDEANQVCRMPEPFETAPPKRAKDLPPSSDMTSTQLDPGLFTASLDNSQIVASMDLELTDRDGLQSRSKNDIEGVIHSGTVAVNRELFTPGLDALKGTTKTSGDTTTKIKDVGFNPATQSYFLDLEVTKKFWKVPVWDNFRVEVKANAKGEMVVQLSDNWFPDKKILTQLEQTVRDTLKSKVPANLQTIKLETEQQGNQLILRPQLKQLDVPLGSGANITLTEMDSKQAKLRLDNGGNLHVDLHEVKVQGSTGSAEGPAAPGVPDKVRLETRIGLGKDGSRQTLTNGHVEVKLNESETANIKLGNDRLSDFVKSGTIDGDFSLYTNKQPGKTPEIQSRSQVRVKNADLGDGQKADLETALKLDFDGTNGIKLDTLDHDYQPLHLHPSQNGVEFFVNGTEYYPEMKKLISSAKESVALETYMFTNDAVGRELADLLARKAAGLDPAAQAPKMGKDTSKGVDVRFVFNSWKGNEHDGKASEEMLRQARAKVDAEIDKSSMSPAQKAKAKANLAKNLNWTFFTEGILRSDHRKVLVVDGSQATVGGMNMGEHYLSEDGYHDVMVKVAGPEVRNIHKEFLENWYEFRKEPPPEGWENDLKSRNDLLRSLEKLQAEGKYKAKAGVQTLVTDDRQIDIERGMIDLIDNAQNEINIEQAFFSDETIVKHLAEVMQKRKIKVNVIVAADPLASSVFKPANLLSAYELAKLQKAGAPGQIQLHYYTHEKGGERNHIHTKAMSV
ncbi:MAG: phosphatidylserine/phosphatidylglycerophosphate/cardiolipin synthase family protein, partial [Candidatus Sericytochromatia bacterium]